MLVDQGTPTVQLVSQHSPDANKFNLKLDEYNIVLTIQVL